jgi:hypothetical protein
MMAMLKDWKYDSPRGPIIYRNPAVQQSAAAASAIERRGNSGYAFRLPNLLIGARKQRMRGAEIPMLRANAEDLSFIPAFRFGDRSGSPLRQAGKPFWSGFGLDGYPIRTRGSLP